MFNFTAPLLYCSPDWFFLLLLSTSRTRQWCLENYFGIFWQENLLTEMVIQSYKHVVSVSYGPITNYLQKNIDDLLQLSTCSCVHFVDFRWQSFNRISRISACQELVFENEIQWANQKSTDSKPTARRKAATKWVETLPWSRDMIETWS